MSAARDLPELGDLLAARAAGEGAPASAREVEIALERSPAARAELAELAATFALARNALPAADAARRARVAAAIAAARGRTSLRRRIAAAAALLALLAAALVWRAQRDAPAPAGERGPQRLALGELFSELAPHGGAPWSAQVLAEPRTPRLGGGGGSGRPESWLAPVAAQVSFAPLRAEQLPPDTQLARASVLRASASGPPSDAFWLRYDGPSGGIALLECAASPESRAWLDGVRWPVGWSARVDERAGVLVATACAGCDAEALAALAAALEPIAR